MRFKYVCSDCGKEYITDKIMYQCPDCSKLNDGKSFPKGNLIVKLDKEVLKKAKEKEHVTPNDFYHTIITNCKNSKSIYNNNYFQKE